MAKTVHRMPGVIPGTRIAATPQRTPRRWGWLLLIILALGVYWVIFRSSLLAVQHVELIGADNEAVKELANRQVGQNIFAINQTALEADMQQAYPSVFSADIVRGLPHTLRITVKLRDPALRWQVNDHVYILDATGQIFQEGDRPDYATLPLIQDKSGVNLEVGQQIVTQDFVTFIQTMQKAVPDTFKLALKSIEISDTTFQVDALLESDRRIRLTTQRPLQEQLDAAQRILAAHSDAHTIDVRVTQWGYWQ